ncbi:MAG: hypothetical protein VX768_18230, partial [Planctomycetota bacterium]|nr:hypothetical protein [Planctomycetota bacterium]
TKRKPVLQETPASSFVPPVSSGVQTEGEFHPTPVRTNPLEARQDPNGGQLGKGTRLETENRSGFSLKDSQSIKPLRNSVPVSPSFADEAGRPDSVSPSAAQPTGETTAVGGSQPQPAAASSQDRNGLRGSFQPPTAVDTSPIQSKLPEARPDETGSFISREKGESASSSLLEGNEVGQFKASQSDLPEKPARLQARPVEVQEPKSVNNGFQSQAVDSLGKPSKPTETATVDSSYNPQLKEIAEWILNSVKRPRENRFSLAEAIQFARDSTHRKQIIRQYWSSFVIEADLQAAEEELQWLRSLPSPISSLDRLMLRAALSSAESRLAEARVAERKSTWQLHRLAPGFDVNRSVCFADLPWVGKYRTNSDGFVKAGRFDSRIRKVDTALPSMRDLAHLRGGAFYDNLAALRESMLNLDSGKISLTVVINLHKETRDQRMAFFKQVRDYNHAITDYALTVYPSAREPLKVARMLIDTDVTLPDDSLVDRAVRQAGGVESIDELDSSGRIR